MKHVGMAGDAFTAGKVAQGKQPLQIQSAESLKALTYIWMAQHNHHKSLAQPLGDMVLR